MGQVITVGLDIAKHVFQVHGIDDEGVIVIRRKVRRSELLNFFRAIKPCLVGIEACATAHHWGRELSALGHQVRLMPPLYVKPYVKRQKNDMADAEAICEAVSRPTMRFVPLKTAEQQAVLMLHRSRELLIRQRTMLINALRGHLAEFGIVMRQGAVGVAGLIAVVEDRDGAIEPMAHEALLPLVAQLHEMQGRIAHLDRRILDWHPSNAASRRLATIPGVGPITASAIVATITDPSLFRSGRQLAAWLGLVPRQTSSGGKDRLGHITKKGDGYIRRLLIVGAHAVLRFVRSGKNTSNRWAAELIARKPYKVAATALANKMARIIWALLTRQEEFKTRAA